MNLLQSTCAGVPCLLVFSFLLGSLVAPTAQVSGGVDPLAELPLVAPFGLPFVGVSVGNDEPRWVGLDTGATQVFLDRTWAGELGLDVTELGVQQQPGGKVAFGQASGVTINLGELRWPELTCGIVDMKPLEGAIGRPINGIIGFDLFQKYVVEIDYAGGRVRLFEPETYEYSGPGSILNLTLKRTKPLVSLQLTRSDGSQLSGQFLVDAGSTQAVSLSSHFYERVLSSGQRSLAARGWGFGGAHATGRLLRLSRAELGPFAFNDVAAYAVVNDGTSGQRPFDGIIGGELLRRFKVVFDYSRSRMILEPNDALDERVRESLSGMELAGESAKLEVISVFAVYEGSAAHRAGIREGDVLLEVDGKAADSYGLEGLWNLLRAGDGREHCLRMGQDGTEHEVTIRLERLPI